MILDPIRLIIGAVFLLYASVLDIRTRRVQNIVWVILGAIGILFLHLHILLEGSWYHHFVILPLIPLYSFPFLELEKKPDLQNGIITPIMWYLMIAVGFLGIIILIFFGGSGFFNLTLLATCVFIVLIYLMYFTGLIFGGADAKGMMALTLLVPFYPHFSKFPLFETDIEAIELVFTFPVVILTMSVVIFAFLPLAMAGYNLTRGDFGLPMFLGYKRKLTEIPGTFVWLMERPQYKNSYGIKLMTMVGETSGMEDWLREQMFTGEITMEYFPKKSSVNTMDTDLRILEKQGRDSVWVTPKIPFMVAIFVGYIVAFLFGNLLFALMDRIMG